ncbi:MAG TPA: hypothetical protein VGM70_03515 [Pseudolysinimonas sp.]
MPHQDATTRRRVAPDLRLVLGVLLVVGSVVGVFAIVSAADRRVTVYAAGSALAPGERIDAGDLVQRTVALDGADRLYLAAGRIPDDGLIVTQPVAKGELLPTSSVGSTAGVRSTSLVLQLATTVSGAVVPGASIDIWAAPDPDAAGRVTISDAGEADGSAPDSVAAAPDPTVPSVLVSGAIVVKVLDDSGGVSVSSAGSSVEVLVPRTRVARLLQAIASKDALAVLPAGIPLAESTESVASNGDGS